ncbi:alpha/beta hydrolase [Thalassospira sp. TSL5-1]|uniref:alpha/beta hydrolase n=1 Tax=Thalassospira sp. TSL5-1 TaxID=1544451 RepID=UPI00093D3A00|nr:alpha/beta hydrolase [Thalassospira sp. TSL5-1]OKH86697.1 carboxylesterase [Thalassospira sp. TSL5-1]
MTAEIPPMPTDEGIIAFQKQAESFYPPDAVSASIEQQRAWYDAFCASFNPPDPAGLRFEDGEIAGVPVRYFHPSVQKTACCLLYFHGGGFVVGSRDSHHAICAEIAEFCGAELISVDYRLAPEHIWPAASDDGYAVLSYLLRRGHRTVVMGDSAGANMTAGLMIRAQRDDVGGRIAGQVLLYPALGGDMTRGSYVEMAQAPGLTTQDVHYYRDILQAPENDAVAHPLKADDVSNLPPAYISSAFFDPLRDDGRHYAAKLVQAGVNVIYREEPQMVHGWLRARHMSDGARTGFDHLCRAVAGFCETGP